MPYLGRSRPFRPHLTKPVIATNFPSILTNVLPTGTVGAAYTGTLFASGGVTPYTWSIVGGALPSPLVLNASTGAITGTPTSPSSQFITFKLVDNNGSIVTKPISLAVVAAPIIITSTLPDGVVGVSYLVQLQVSGGVTPFTWTLQSGSLPTGLSLSSAGVISGVPTTAETLSFTVKVTDVNGVSNTQILTLEVVAASITSAIVSALSVSPVNYNGLQVNWGTPGGIWTQQMLLRSSTGTPTNVETNDGVTLLSQSSGFSTTYTDTSLQSGHFYYYSLFVFVPSLGEWVLAGSAQGLVLTYYGFGSTFAGWMPDWYIEQDESLTPATPLQRLLNLFGYETDWMRSEIESFFLFSDIDHVSGALLPYVGSNYGIDYEPELGMTRSRVLIKNAVNLYKERGTSEGIQAAASGYSGYGCSVTIGPNLEPQLDDAAFDSFGQIGNSNYAGHWIPGGGTTIFNTTIPYGPEGLNTILIPPPGTSYILVLTSPLDPSLGLNLQGVQSHSNYPSFPYSGWGTWLFLVSGGGDTSYQFVYGNNNNGCVPTTIQVLAFSGSVTSITTQTAANVGLTPEHVSYNPAPVLGTPGPPPSLLNTEGYLPANNVNVAIVTNNGGPIWVESSTDSEISTLGIPIPQTNTPTYVFSAYFQPVQPVSLRSFFTELRFYSLSGAHISDVIGTAVTEVAGSWVRASVVATPPAGAYWMKRVIQSTTFAYNDLHAMDAVQTEINTQATPGPTAWQPPRDIKVNLLPRRQNLIVNPQGLGGSAGWALTGGTLTESTSGAIPWPAGTTGGLVLTAAPTFTAKDLGGTFGGGEIGAMAFGGAAFGSSGSSGPVENMILSTTCPVNGAGLSLAYSFSCYMMAATSPRLIQIAITYYNASSVLVSSQAFAGTLSQTLVQGQTYSSVSVNALGFQVVAGQSFIINLGGLSSQLVTVTATAPVGATTISVNQFVANSTYAAGTIAAFSYTTFTDTTSSFVRGVFTNTIAPLTATTAQIQISISTPTSGEAHYFAAPLFAPEASLLPYFDANFGPDYIWEGTANNSVSDYYPSLIASVSRLVTVLPRFIPIGSTFSLVTGSQALTNAGQNG